jgi:hypothetical protein
MMLTSVSTTGLAVVLTATMVLYSCGSATTTKDQRPREIHTAAYDLIIPAEQKSLPLLRRSGYAQAQ